MSSIILKKFDWDRDVLPIDEIFKRQSEISVPSLDNVIANNSIIDDSTGRLIGYGVIKLFAEGVLILDRSIPKRKRAEAVKVALNECIAQAKNAGLEYLYVVSSMPSYVEILRNKFKFRNCPGQFLVLDLTSTKEEN